jgi:hypothetical protein
MFGGGKAFHGTSPFSIMSSQIWNGVGNQLWRVAALDYRSPDERPIRAQRIMRRLLS